MAQPPRLTLSDLLAEYSLHSDRRHIYVEGLCDRLIVEWVLDSAKVTNVVVYCIDDIDVPYAKLSEYGLDGGAKARLKVLARELRNVLVSRSSKVICVVDADYDYLLDQVEVNPYLLYTDGTSIEMYSYTADLVDRILRLALDCSTMHVENVLDELHPILTDVFAIRATNEKLQLNLRWLPFERRCKIQGDGTFDFDRHKFIRDYLNKNGAIGRLDEFEGCYKELRKVRVSDRRQIVRGHDFVALLACYCQQRRHWFPGKLPAGDVMYGFLRLVLDEHHISSERLFRQLVDTFG